MSQFSSANSDSSSDDDTSQLSSTGSTGWYGHWSDGASSSASQPNWQKELQKREVRGRKREEEGERITHTHMACVRAWTQEWVLTGVGQITCRLTT